MKIGTNHGVGLNLQDINRLGLVTLHAHVEQHNESYLNRTKRLRCHVLHCSVLHHRQ